MKTRILPAQVLIFPLLLLMAGCDLVSSQAGGNKNLEPILASGVIEAEQINIASELPGRIEEIHVEEGSSVSAGDLVISLEEDLLAAQNELVWAQFNSAVTQLDSARAAQEIAQANLASAEANLIAAKIQYKQALAQQAFFEREGRVSDWFEITPNQSSLPAWFFQQPEKISAAEGMVEIAWEDYLDENNNFQEFVSKIDSEDYLEAESRLAAAQAAFQVASTLRERPIGFAGWEEIKNQVDTYYDTAKTELEEAQEAYEQILSDLQYEEVLAARARVSVARERYDLARDYLAGQYIGSYSLDVQAAEALVAQAEAGLLGAQALLKIADINKLSAENGYIQAELAGELNDLQLEKLQIHSPISGVVLTSAAGPGEVIGAGYTLMTVGDLSNLTVTVYLPENRYGQVKMGDTAELTIDSYPDKTFVCEVIYISDQAEYTPRNVQTQEERQHTVYAVKLRVENIDDILKPGMPADVVFYP